MLKILDSHQNLQELWKRKESPLWSKIEKKRHVDKDALWVKAQNIKALEPKKKGRVGGDLNIYTGEATFIKEHASLKDDPIEEISQKHLEKLMSVQMVLDTFDGKHPKEVMLYFLEDGRIFKLESEDLQTKHWNELKYVLYLLKSKN